MIKPPPPRRAMSITWRLVGGYTFVALLTLSLAAIFVHGRLRRSFEIEDAELLADNVAAVRGEVGEEPETLAEATEIIREAAGDRQIEKYYGRLLDSDGRVIVETPGASEVAPPPEQFPAAVPVDQRVRAVMYAKSPNGNPTWLAAGLVSRGPGHSPLTYQVALDTRQVEKWLREFRHTLVLIVGGAATVSALLGWVITRRGLRPLAEITATAQRITASGLDEHVGGKIWPRELASLAMEFDRMLARLRGSFERLSQFTADAAHEFRTPLNNLLGATTLALSRPRSVEELNALLEANLEEYHRLHQLMERLLFLARADDAQTVVDTRMLQAADAIREVTEFFSPLAEDRGIALECHGDGPLKADPALFRMALSNLISNALRHAPAGTKVIVAAANRNDGGIFISVQNEGKGITPDHLPRLFDRFYRVEDSRSGGEGLGGSGLGLALVKTIMDLHGGTASVESTAARSTVFRLFFPIRGPGSQAASGSGPQSVS